MGRPANYEKQHKLIKGCDSKERSELGPSETSSSLDGIFEANRILRFVASGGRPPQGPYRLDDRVLCGKVHACKFSRTHKWVGRESLRMMVMTTRNVIACRRIFLFVLLLVELALNCKSTLKKRCQFERILSQKEVSRPTNWINKFHALGRSQFHS